MMTTNDPEDPGCEQDVTLLFGGLEIWLRTEIDPTGRDRDAALSDLLADLALHLDRLGGDDLDSSPATFAAEERLLNVLDRLGIATNDVHSLVHLAMGCALQARDAAVVYAEARHTWESLRSGTAPGADEPLTPALFIGDPL